MTYYVAEQYARCRIAAFSAGQLESLVDYKKRPFSAEFRVEIRASQREKQFSASQREKQFSEESESAIGSLVKREAECQS
jgi:hypothetical protein